MREDRPKQNAGQRGVGKPVEFSYVKAARKEGSRAAAQFHVPIPVCRDLGVADGGIIEFQRRQLESGAVEYVLRSVAKKDIFTGEQDGEFVEFCGKDVSKESIVKLALKSGLVEEIMVEYDRQIKKDMEKGAYNAGTTNRAFQYWKRLRGIE